MAISRTVRRIVFRAISVAALSCLPGCRSTTGPSVEVTQEQALPPYAPGQCPRFLMVYLPYQRNGVPLAFPSPTTPGWTDQRMARDLSRIVGAGLDGVILGLQPEILDDAFQTERVARFVELVATRSPAEFAVSLLFLPSSAVPETVTAETIGKWLTTSDMYGSKRLSSEGGRVRIMLAPGLSPVGPPHPAVALVSMDSPGGPWRWSPPKETDRLVPTVAERQVVVYGGWRGTGLSAGSQGGPAWELERRHGRALEAELRQALAARALVICISSWNDYVAGDFIEPNSLDGDAALKRLTLAIRAAKSACR